MYFKRINFRSFLSLHSLELTLVNFLLLLTKLTECSECRYTFKNGTSIDLSSIGAGGEARFQNVKPADGKNYTYYFNPCIKFSLSDTECQNVKVCQVSTDKNNYYNCGVEGNIDWNPARTNLVLTYTSGGDSPRTTAITLVCSSNAETPNLTVQGELETNHYSMTLTTRCACPGLCDTGEEHHLSAGSVLVILFLIGVSLYLILGIIHSSLTRGAHGWELIPNYEFWAEFPLLVRDGCVFVVNGCKADTAYERI